MCKQITLLPSFLQTCPCSLGTELPAGPGNLGGAGTRLVESSPAGSARDFMGP